MAWENGYASNKIYGLHYKNSSKMLASFLAMIVTVIKDVIDRYLEDNINGEKHEC